MAESQEESCEIVLKGGSDISDARVVFSSDSRYLAGCCGSEVKVWSVASGQVVQRLKGHRSKVTSIALNPNNVHQLYSACQSGLIIKWDFVDGVKLSTTETKTSLLALLPTSSCFYGLGGSLSSKTANLVSVHVTKKSEPKVKQIKSGIVPADNALACGYQDLFITAITSSHLIIHTPQLTDKALMVSLKDQPKNIYKSEAFCCVAAHPSEMCIATGMKDGKIIIWWFCITERKITATQPLHWHSLSVRDVAFTPLGANFISGGHECVLVRWQHNGSEKNFLPRLGSAISRVTVSQDNTLYAICHADNSIQIISRDFKVIQVIQGLTLVQGHSPSGLLADPRSGALVTNGRPGHVQFYSFQNDTQLFNLDIVCQNYISSENLKRPLIHTEVKASAFSHNGDWFVTVEERIDGKTTPEIKMKFWLYEPAQQKYILNTSVALPHADAVTSISMRPYSPEYDLQAVTTSKDGRFKIWSLIDDSDIYRKRQCWSCDSVGFYRKLSPTKAVYSNDGSILAVAFNSTLTLWDPDNFQLCEALCNPSSIVHLAAGGSSSSHIIITATKSHLLAWNLLSCSVHWCLVLSTQSLVTKPDSNILAVFDDEHKLQVFKIDTCEELFTLSNVATVPVTAAVFLPYGRQRTGKMEWLSSCQLYFMTSQQELYTVEDEGEEVDSSVKKLKQDLPENTLTQILRGKAHSNRLSKEEDYDSGNIGQIRSQVLSEIMSTPSHVMPLVSTLCLPLLSDLLKKSSNAAKEDEEEDSEEDMEVEEDSDEEEPSSQQKKDLRANKLLTLPLLQSLSSSSFKIKN